MWRLLLLLAAGSAAAAPPSPPDAQAMLAAHNQVRARVGVPALGWSDALAAEADSWARHLVETGRFDHRTGSPHGENLYAITGGMAAPAQVVAAWASEARDYDLAGNRCASVCGHYTQIVWKATREVGCSAALGGRRQVWVCVYDPPGNVIGFRPY